MFSKRKTTAVVFALLLSATIMTTGCNTKKQTTWVNTNSMPGQAFTKNNARHQSSSTIVYLGDDNAPNVSFGPKDVSFKFKDLK